MRVKRAARPRSRVDLCCTLHGLTWVSALFFFMAEPRPQTVRSLGRKNRVSITSRALRTSLAMYWLLVILRFLSALPGSHFAAARPRWVRAAVEALYAFVPPGDRHRRVPNPSYGSVDPVLERFGIRRTVEDCVVVLLPGNGECAIPDRTRYCPPGCYAGLVPVACYRGGEERPDRARYETTALPPPAGRRKST